MATEGIFPKTDGDRGYGSEATYQAGNCIQVTAGENITSGNVVYILESDGKAYISDNATESKYQAIGIAIQTKNIAEAIAVQTQGKWITAGLVANDTYYLGASGAISQTESLTKIGYAYSTTILMIDIENFKQFRLDFRSTVPGYTATGIRTGGGWVTKTSMLAARAAGATAVVNRKIYCIGGSTGVTVKTNDEYDPILDTWSNKADMTTARYGCVAAVYNSVIYVFGAASGGVKNEAYTPASNTWASKLDMTTGGGSCSAGTVGTKIYVIGGENGAGMNTNREYDPVGNTWDDTKTVQTTGRAYCFFATYNDKIYTIAGNKGVGLAAANEHEVYTPATNSWANKTVYPASVGNAHPAAVIGNNIICSGGNDGAVIATTRIYSVTNNSWSSGTAMTAEKSSAFCGTYNNSVYLMGGTPLGGGVTDTSYMYTPAIPIFKKIV